MKLERAIALLSGRTLDAALEFWSLDRQEWPAEEARRREYLARCMTDPARVNDRLTHLPSRLRDLLRHVVRSVEWSKPFDLATCEPADLPVERFELGAVATALSERMFFVSSRVRGRSSATADALCYVICSELGHGLERAFEVGQRPIEAGLSLRAYLRYLDRTVLAGRLEELGLGSIAKSRARDIAAELTQPECLADRIGRIRDPALAACFEGLLDHGGVIDEDARRRLEIETDGDTLQRWGSELEELLLGTFERTELTNHGIAVREGWLVVFEELVGARARLTEVDDDEAESDLLRAPDALADLRGIAHELERSPFRIKKDGNYYKSAVKKTARAALSPGVRLKGAEEDLVFFLEFFSRSEFSNRGSDGRLRITSSWRDWDRRAAADRARDLLRFCSRPSSEGMSSLHRASLRKLFLAQLRELHATEWTSTRAVTVLARNRYLAEATRPEHAQRYQDRHKHAPFPPLATPDIMRRELLNWVVEGPARIGLVELSQRDGEVRPWALRLTPLGASMVGLKVAESTSVRTGGLVVNSDCEIILFPDVAGFEVMQQVGRFANRVKADFAVHYTVDRESIQRAAATGMTAADILKVLTENSSSPIPSNVSFSIEEWCAKVIRIESRRSFVIETPDAKALDRLLAVTEVKGILARRLSPTVAELNEDPSRPAIIAALRERGFYM